MYWTNLLHIYQPPDQRKQIIDQVVKESYNKILDILEANPKIKISLNICASLTEQLIKYGYQNIIERIKNLAEKKQIELLGSAAYHPILPLYSKTEVIRQIKLNENINQKYFGKVWRPRPKGFFLPEMAYDKKTARIIQSLGYQWVALDEIAYNGKFGQISFEQGYQIKDLFLNQKNKNLKIIFRHRDLSSLFFGRWLDSVDKFFSAVKKDKQTDKYLITAFDGENLGHHQRHLADLWAEILKNKQIKTITCSEYLNLFKNYPFRQITPLASSWSTEIKDLNKNIPYPLWQDPDNQIHQLQWQINNLIIKIVKSNQTHLNYKKARKILDQAICSDQYWWASARPWWGPEMIEQGLNRFLKISLLLRDKVSLEEQKKVRKLSQEILQKIEKKDIKNK